MALPFLSSFGNEYMNDRKRPILPEDYNIRNALNGTRVIIEIHFIAMYQFRSR